MRLILHRYIFKEILPVFAACLFIFVFVMLATQMLSITEMIVSRGAGVGQMFRMVVYLLPDVITFSLPAACLMAVVIAFLRLSSDNEIIAFKSSGISPFQMLPPVVLFAGLSMIAASVISVFAVPWGTRSFNDSVFTIAQSRADLGVRERIFSEPFDRLTFYVTSFSPRERTMRDVFVMDRRDTRVRNTIVAKEARLFSHRRQKVITIRFQDGTIFMDETGSNKRRTIQFTTYDLNVGLKDILPDLKNRRKGPRELSLRELIRRVEAGRKGESDYNEAIVELWGKVTIPLAVFLMAIIGAPLGTQIKAKGRSTGIGVSLFVFLVYYMCLAAVRSLSEEGNVPPKIGVWLPDFFLMLATVLLLWSAARERLIKIFPDSLLKHPPLRNSTDSSARDKKTFYGSP